MIQSIGLLAAAIWLAMTGAAVAVGNLKIVSWFTGELTCTYGSGAYQRNSGQTARIGHGAIWTFAAGENGVQTIDWLKCGDAVARNMAISLDSPDHMIVIAGPPQRAL